MAKFTEVDPQKLLEAKRREVEIAELEKTKAEINTCLLYTSDAADE